MKSITEYQIPYLTKEKVITKQEDGSELSKFEEVKKHLKVIIKEPSRKEIVYSQNIYQETWSDAVRRGILTRAIIDKSYSNNEGFLSESDKKQLEDAAEKIQSIRKTWESEFKDVKEEDQTETQKEEINKLSEELVDAQSEFDKLESQIENIYINSAETIAYNKKILYETLFLTHIEKDGKTNPIVEGNTLDERLAGYDKILENQKDDEGKSRAEMYGNILRRNGRILDLLYRGKIEMSQLPKLHEQIEAGKVII